MDIGDLIYVIAVLGISLFSLLKKNKRPASSSPPSPQQGQEAKQTSVNWEKIWGELKDIRGDIESFQETLPTPPPKPQKAQHNTQNTYVNKKHTYTHKEEQEVFAEPKEDTQPVFSISDLDDMKKAVIYSEILNRKYN